MLKLPKGLKKKKKDKKSKKNQELFTEEELAAYKERELREKQVAAEAVESTAASEQGQQYAAGLSSTSASASVSAQQAAGDDDEWLKFKSLTTGIDTVLKKTQGNLDRIKESSFFQRVPTDAEKQKTVQNKADAVQKEAEEQQRHLEEAQRAAVPQPTEEERFLASAVVELSESEEESDDANDIFDTAYIDTLASANVELYVPESPVEDFDAGPDPFDTTYADKIINGPEVSKRGKKLVNIGAAVEVLTGRVEKVAQNTARRPRRGPQNLLLESFDDGTVAVGQSVEPQAAPAPEKPVQTLLDDIPDDIPAGPIDLSVSLHIQFLKEQKEKKQEEQEHQKQLLSEFDNLQGNAEDEELDEFAALAAESLNKHEDVHVLKDVSTVSQPEKDRSESDWAAFSDPSGKPPARPPPPRVISATVPIVSSPLDEFATPDNDDPFDTTFADRVLPIPDDEDFDPRKDEIIQTALAAPATPNTAKAPIDLLNDTNEELEKLAHPVITHQTSVVGSAPEVEIDPFDTSAIASIVQPKATEIRFLEQELLSDTANLSHSLSDPDFDPRADEPIEENPKIDLNRRKSSLSLNIASVCLLPKTVGFATDLLGVSNTGGAKIQKPLTPYYAQGVIEENEKETEDPFDTSFVPVGNPSQVEINILEKDFGGLHHSISDPDFDPRAITPIPPNQADLLAVDEEHNIKVLTPASNERKSIAQDSLNSYVDPFDTSSIERNILPGRAELKIIEDELLPATITEFSSRITVLDSCSDSQELGLGGKVLTPQVPFSAEPSLEEQDPFDTSIANNLAPGQAEIKQLESELIHQ